MANARQIKKDLKKLADQTADQQSSMEGMQDVAQTLTNILTQESRIRSTIVSKQANQNNLAEKYVTHVKNALGAVKQMPGAFQEVTQAMVRSKKKEERTAEATSDKIKEGYQEQKEAAADSVNSPGLLAGIKRMVSFPLKMMKNLVTAKAVALGVVGVITAGVTTLFTFIIGSLLKFNTRIDKVGQAFGFLAQGGGGIFFDRLSQAAIDVTRIGGNIEDVIAVTKTLNEQFGIGLGSASSQAKEIVELAKGTGIANEEAAKLTGILQRNLGLSTGQRKNFVDVTKNLALQRGQNPARVLQQMANASVQVQAATGFSAENLRDAALNATDAGIELSSIADTQKGLLDLQTTFANEVLTNIILQQAGIEGINLAEARRLRTIGDQAGLLQESQRIIQQITRSEGFRAANAFQQEIILESIAKSLNTNLETVQKLNVAEKLTRDTAKDLKEQLDISMAPLDQQLTSILGPVSQLKMEISAILTELGSDIFKEFQPTLKSFVKEFRELVQEGKLEGILTTIVDIAGQLANIISKTSAFIDKIAGFSRQFEGSFMKGFGRMLGLNIREPVQVDPRGEVAIGDVTGLRERSDAQVLQERMNRPFPIQEEHDLPSGAFAMATAPNVPVMITGTGDPEGIVRKSTLDGMVNNEDMKEGLENVVDAINNLNLETVISADQIKVIMHKGM